MALVFIVEDDNDIRQIEAYALKCGGFEIEEFEDAKALYERLEKKTPDLFLLDVMLPDEDGMSILARLRADKRYTSIPVIMATAKGSEYDKVKGLDGGADDYIAKPFGMLEMVARIKAVLRRCASQQSAKTDDGLIRRGTLEVHELEHQVRVGGEAVVLTLKEYELLKLLLLHPGIVFSRDKLLNDIWGYEFSGETRTVDVHIRTLRQKLGEAGELIETIRGVGYRMAAEK